MFEQVFTSSLQKFTADQAVLKDLWSDITTHYSHKDRQYHNLSHLDHLACELLGVKDRIADWDLIVFSIAYHDIIYDTSRSDNEEKSADYAAIVLSNLLPPARIQKCKEAIQATKKHPYNNDPDINHFTDADLSIFGAFPEQYLEYAGAIRKEYRALPNNIYNPGRQQVLNHFLQMNRIYKTPYFFHKYEQQARTNLKMELTLLSNTSIL
jgi:predicted metal-dependent HD superfamily phosphohydrolase